MRKNKYFLSVFLLLLFSEACKNSGETIKVRGSDTVLLLMDAESEAAKKKGLEITVTGGGSGDGIEALINGTTDLCMSSRELKEEERMKLADARKQIVEKTIAFDALSVIVNKENKIRKLTRKQLKEIFTGKIRNWSEVGGSNEPIVVISRESSSGTFDYFREHVLDNEDFVNTSLMKANSGAVDAAVSQSANAIGYVGMAYMERERKICAIDICWDDSAACVFPSVANALNKTYPISRPLYILYDTSHQESVGRFIDFLMSAEGQKVVANVGYVPLPK